MIPNDRLLQMADRQMSLVESFRLADDVLRHGVQGISDLVTMTGLINLDFADVKAVMQNAGTALMAVGEGARRGPRDRRRARRPSPARCSTCRSTGARGVLLNVSGGPDLTLAEVTEAAETIPAAVDPDASIFFGAVIHPRQQDEVRVTVIATGLRDAALASQSPSAARARTRVAAHAARGARDRTNPRASQRVSRSTSARATTVLNRVGASLAPATRSRGRPAPRRARPHRRVATTTGTCLPSCAAPSIARR